MPLSAETQMVVAVDPVNRVYAYTQQELDVNLPNLYVSLIFKPWKGFSYKEGNWSFYNEFYAPPVYLDCLIDPSVQLAEGGEIDDSLRERLYEGSIYAGLVINTCGTAFPHPLGYVLTENYGIPHGMACAAFFGAFIDRCERFAPEKAAEFAAMTDDIAAVRGTIGSLLDLDGVKISRDEAERYALRWQSGTPKNFAASPGGLTQEEAAGILVSL